MTVKECLEKLESLAIQDIEEDLFYIGATQILEQYANQPKWIPNSERLPEKEDANSLQKVLVYRKSGKMQLFHYNQVKIESWGVIAWQPLPEPYKP